MSQNPGNVPISLLLGTSDSTSQSNSNPSLLNIVSQFQTSIGVPNILNNDSNSLPAKPTLSNTPSNLPQLAPKHHVINTVSPSPDPSSFLLQNNPNVVSDHLKQFQTSFLTLPSTSKTSINSIINLVNEPEVPIVEPAKEKKKRAPPKRKEGEPAKKRKTENEKLTTPTAEGVKKKKAPAKPKTETDAKKPPAKPKKKSPEKQDPPPLTDPVVHPTMTTERGQTTEVANLPAPLFIEAEEKIKQEEKKEEKTKEEKTKEEEKPLPIIALNIPLLDPKNPQPGQAAVVINVLKLAEEKYGWSSVHPNAKSAIDLMDEMIDEDEDIEEDDDDEVPAAAPEGEVKPAPPSKKKEEEELTEEQLVRQHEVKMNRKVGKYDYEDPFIDDEELQWEDEITSTKEGFFVYWGPLVDDRSNSSNKKTAKRK